MRTRLGIDGGVMSGGYFSDMSLVDWIGVVVMAPLLFALAVLMIYLVIGMIGSAPRRRRIANKPPGESTSSKSARSPHQTPGD